MAITLNTKYLRKFVSDSEFSAMQPFVETAHRLVTERTGLGNDFLG